jgi:hypothetical protein
MGERWLKAEEAVIQTHYPTSRRWEILARIPGRTLVEIGAKARKMGIHRTKEAKGDSIREGRKSHKDAGENHTKMRGAIYKMSDLTDYIL